MFIPFRSMEKPRTCLRCGNSFLSLSSANRICPSCKARSFGPVAEPVRLPTEEREFLHLVIDYQLFLYREPPDDAFDTDDLDEFDSEDSDDS